MILCLETATSICSVALCDRSGVVALKESNEGRSHASLLTLFIEEAIKESGVRISDLEAIAVSKGPGSYTGLRIGVSAAKGMAYAVSIPLLSVDTTFSMFLGFKSSDTGKYGYTGTDLFCPSLDARRMEIYYAVYDLHGTTIREINAEVINSDSMNSLPERSRLFIFGDGATKCQEIIKRKNIIFDSSFRISASSMQKAAYDALDAGHFEDVAYFEPFYLKDFLTTKPVKNMPGK